ncbi:autotransporter domain-containing protein [Roseibium sp.]|uniref:autotransporter family protein n=1 Tax=Roseibium sp. TaxID=1936156 RepID=UPI003BAB2DCB
MVLFPRQQKLTALCAGVFMFAAAEQTRADDFIVDTDETTTQVVDGDDTLVVTEDGSIITTDEYGINSSGSGNTITNWGLISTSGVTAGGSRGIYNTGDGARITNEGTIRTTQSASEAILNSSGHNTIIINNGAIMSVASGIRNLRGNNVTIINNGSIETSGNAAHGIRNYGDFTDIRNVGSIRTGGSGITSGIYLQNGLSSAPFEGVTVFNNGTIIGEQGYAIRVGINYTDPVVNLNAPSFLGGGIEFNSDTTLNIDTGPSHSVLWQLPTTNVAGGEANISGTVPWFYDPTTGQFATFEPTGLSASFNQLADNANTLARLGRYGLRQAGRLAPAAAVSAALAYGEDATQTSDGFDALLATNSGPEAAYGFKSGHFWITGFGGTANYEGDGSTLDQTIDQIGAAAGYAWSQSSVMRLGVMAGYMNGTITAKSTWADSQDIDSNGVFAGIYGDRRFGRVTVGCGVAGGWQSNDSTRFINDNTALTGGLTLGESWASASYESWFITPEASLSAAIQLGDTGLVLTPTVRGRYALQHTAAYEESGSNANASVDAHSLGVVEGDFELAVSRDIGPAALTGRAGYLLRSSVGDDDVPVTLLGITNAVGLDATDRSAAYAGASLDLHLGSNASFTLDGQGTFSDDVDALQGMARLAIRF